MRITGGEARGRIIKVPKGFAVRPTPDMMRQAMFNSLGGNVCGARVLELFAGSGALSLECMSRGALGSICVEKVVTMPIFCVLTGKSVVLIANRYHSGCRMHM